MKSLPVDVIARIERLELAARAVVEGHLAGRHRSPRHGFAVEFAQHREYSPGDDPKHIDWKVFGRTERHQIKQFEQETNLVAWLIVDASESMRYASASISKYDLACTAAAALTALIVRQGDSVGAVAVADRAQNWLKPSSSPGQPREVLRTLSEVSLAGVGNVGGGVEEVAGRLGRRCITMIFSDLLDVAEPFLNALKHLKFQKHDVVVFQTLDAAELDFPFRHPTLFKGLEMQPSLSTDPLGIRETYLKSLNSHLALLDEGCRRLAIDRVLLRTDCDLGSTLATYLQKRLS